MWFSDRRTNHAGQSQYTLIARHMAHVDRDAIVLPPVYTDVYIYVHEERDACTIHLRRLPEHRRIDEVDKDTRISHASGVAANLIEPVSLKRLKYP